MTYHEKTARYYDYFADKRGLPFFRRLMLQLGGPVLELGAGTGRATFDLAGAGLDVVAVDKSQYMMDIAREKLDKQAPSVKDRVELVEADMVEIPLERTFASTLALAGVFSFLLSSNDQIRCLQSVHRLLKPEGKLVLDHVPPDMDMLQGGTIVSNSLNLDGDLSILRTVHHRVDINLQRCNITTIYEQYKGSVMVERVLEESATSLIFPRELIMLLAHTGFSVDKIYGDLNGGIFSSQSKRMVVVAVKK